MSESFLYLRELEILDVKTAVWTILRCISLNICTAFMTFIFLWVFDTSDSYNMTRWMFYKHSLFWWEPLVLMVRKPMFPMVQMLLVSKGNDTQTDSTISSSWQNVTPTSSIQSIFAEPVFCWVVKTLGNDHQRTLWTRECGIRSVCKRKE
jgi:hypothetical protein